MFFKSYDGWQRFESQTGKMLVMAFFTRTDGTTVRYNTGTLADKIRSRPPAMTSDDLGLIQTALDQQIEYVQSYIHDATKGRLILQFAGTNGKVNQNDKIPQDSYTAVASMALQISHP